MYQNILFWTVPFSYLVNIYQLNKKSPENFTGLFLTQLIYFIYAYQVPPFTVK